MQDFTEHSPVDKVSEGISVNPEQTPFNPINKEADYIILNLSVLLDRIDNDIDLAKELLALFLDESKAAVNLFVTSSLSSLSRNDLKKEAHKIKGMCSEIGGAYTAHLAGTLEKMALECDNAGLEQQQVSLSNAYEQLCVEIHDWLQKN